jgi:hypothetical protein
VDFFFGGGQTPYFDTVAFKFAPGFTLNPVILVFEGQKLYELPIRFWLGNYAKLKT